MPNTRDKTDDGSAEVPRLGVGSERRTLARRFLWATAVVLPAIVLVGFVTLWVLATNSASAQTASDAVRFVDAGLESNFPTSLRFHAQVETDLEVEDIRVRFGVGHGEKNRYNYLDLDRSTVGGGTLIDGELEWSFNITGRYIPPGSVIRFHFEVLDADGNEHVSDEFHTVMHDARYEWEEVASGPLKVLYHGPVETRALRLAEAGIELLELMQPITGGETETPITVTMYNNNAEMIGAVQTRSAATSRELITEGQAFHDESVVLVLVGSRDIGTLTHELTHILVGRAAGGTSALVPLWFNEGLAEYGNLDQGLSYQYYLEWAVDTGRLKPFASLSSFPGEPSLNLVAYGQSRSFVSYLIEEYGGDKIAEVLAEIRDGSNGDTAIRTVYGDNLLALENAWRYDLGADEYVPPRISAAPQATATPIPTVAPIQQQATSTPIPTLTPLLLPTPAATATPEVVVQPTDTPEPAPPTAPPAVATAEPEATAIPETSGSGSCGAPARDGRVEAGSVALVLGLLGFAAARAVVRRLT